MQVPLSDGGYILSPITPPPGVTTADLIGYTVELAKTNDGPGEPAEEDWADGIWVDNEAAGKLPDYGITEAGTFKLWYRVTTGQETKVLPGSRITVGY